MYQVQFQTASTASLVKEIHRPDLASKHVSIVLRLPRSNSRPSPLMSTIGPHVSRQSLPSSLPMVAALLIALCLQVSGHVASRRTQADRRNPHTRVPARLPSSPLHARRVTKETSQSHVHAVACRGGAAAGSQKASKWRPSWSFAMPRSAKVMYE